MLLVDKHDAVLTLTLDRPESRNALSPQLIAEIQRQIAAADSDPDVAVVVLTGTDPAFCSRRRPPSDRCRRRLGQYGR